MWSQLRSYIIIFWALILSVAVIWAEGIFMYYSAEWAGTMADLLHAEQDYKILKSRAQIGCQDTVLFIHPPELATIPPMLSCPYPGQRLSQVGEKQYLCHCPGSETAKP